MNPDQRISIKDSLAQLKKEDTPVDQEKLRYSFSSDMLRVASRKYAYQLKEMGKDTFYHALIKRDLTMQDENLRMTLDNEVQVAYITPLLVEFVSFLQKELNNGYITLQLEVSEQQELKEKPVTGKEKYLALSRKNPNLHTLRNRFNLDIEY